jgi:hypothetical protein
MEILDFYRSFVVFELDFEKHPPKTVSDMRQNLHNRARIRIECRCKITRPDGRSAEYYLGEATRSERVGADRGLGVFTQPNAEFRPIMSEEETILLKSWDKNDKGVMLVPASLGPQPERQVIKTSDAFHGYRFQLSYTQGTILEDAPAVIEATDVGLPLVARTEFSQLGYQVVLDYPVWTMNVSERYGAYQTDTGPVIYPDLSQASERVVDCFWLAFCAFNQPGWIEFIVQRPTPVGHGISVNHFTETVWVDDCKNTVIATS